MEPSEKREDDDLGLIREGWDYDNERYDPPEFDVSNDPECAAHRKAVLLAEGWPHGEQHATARALAGIAVPVTAWPEPADWPGLLERALACGGAGWARWSTGDAAVRAAAVLDGMAAA